MIRNDVSCVAPLRCRPAGTRQQHIACHIMSGIRRSSSVEPWLSMSSNHYHGPSWFWWVRMTRNCSRLRIVINASQRAWFICNDSSCLSIVVILGHCMHACKWTIQVDRNGNMSGVSYIRHKILTKSPAAGARTNNREKSSSRIRHPDPSYFDKIVIHGDTRADLWYSGWEKCCVWCSGWRNT